MHNAITDVEGIEVGHWTDLEAVTGCTVILCHEGAVGGVLLTGGSAYGLDAAGGVMRWLEEGGIGFNVGVCLVPIVASAVLFDLNIGRPDVRPGPDAGYAACEAANDGPVPEGCVGAGAGATVGKLLGPAFATKSGLGSASRRIANEITVGALVAVNAFGDVIDPARGEIVAGPRDPQRAGFVNTVDRLHGDLSGTMLAFPTSTTLAVVATDAVVTKEGANKIAQMAHDGLAQVIHPVHTMLDGDTVFTLATAKRVRASADISVLGAVAASVLAEAVVRAVRQATSLAGVPAARDVP
jgi:L-aminopeptidase/D-esterase-like protein